MNFYQRLKDRLDEPEGFTIKVMHSMGVVREYAIINLGFDHIECRSYPDGPQCGIVLIPFTSIITLEIRE